MKNDTIKKLSDKEVWELFSKSSQKDLPQICDELLRRSASYKSVKLKEMSNLAKANIRKNTRAGK